MFAMSRWKRLSSPVCLCLSLQEGLGLQPVRRRGPRRKLGGVCSVTAAGATPAEASRPCWAVALRSRGAQGPPMALVPNGK